MSIESDQETVPGVLTPPARVMPGIPGQWACLDCVAEHKLAIAAGRVELPTIMPAITLVPLPTPHGVASVPACYEHIGVARSSPLLRG